MKCLWICVGRSYGKTTLRPQVWKTIIAGGRIATKGNHPSLTTMAGPADVEARTSIALYYDQERLHPSMVGDLKLEKLSFKESGVWGARIRFGWSSCSKIESKIRCLG